MTKAEIVAQISRQSGIEKTVVMTVIESFMENVKESMVAGNEVFLRGFGSFIIKRRAEKTARNISKNTTIKIPAHNIWKIQCKMPPKTKRFYPLVPK